MAALILVIDDERDMRTYLSTLFKQAGYRVETACNGLEGVDMARRLEPDLITLDLLMPRQSGVRAYRDLRSAAQTASIPVVVLSGLTRQEDFFGESASELPPPEAIVEKPIERESFLQTIRRVLEG